MPGKLSAYVHVKDESGAMVAFGPDDVVPDWAAKQIKNPKAWAKPTTAVDETPPPAETPGTEPPPPSTENRPEPPPKGGPGSGLDAWLEYADRLGVTVPDEASRDDVIAAVEASNNSND